MLIDDISLLEGNIHTSSYNQIADISIESGTHSFDFAQGDMQQLTITGPITLAFSNFIAGQICVFLVDAINWGAFTITHPAGTLFAGGAAPTYTVAGTDRLAIIKDKDDLYTITVLAQDIQ